LRSKKEEINGNNDSDFNEWLAWSISASVFFVISGLAGVLQMVVTHRVVKYIYIGFLAIAFVLYSIAMILAYDSVYFNVMPLNKLLLQVYQYFNIGVISWLLQTFTIFQGIINAIQL
jgi:hypothetical protein